MLKTRADTGQTEEVPALALAETPRSLGISAANKQHLNNGSSAFSSNTSDRDSAQWAAGVLGASHVFTLFLRDFKIGSCVDIVARMRPHMHSQFDDGACATEVLLGVFATMYRSDLRSSDRAP